MAIDRTYMCDLCSTRHEPNSNKLVGIYWTANDAIELRPVREVEHHICRRCVEGISNLRALDAYQSFAR